MLRDAPVPLGPLRHLRHMRRGRPGEPRADKRHPRGGDRRFDGCVRSSSLRVETIWFSDSVRGATNFPLSPARNGSVYRSFSEWSCAGESASAARRFAVLVTLSVHPRSHPSPHGRRRADARRDEELEKGQPAQARNGCPTSPGGNRRGRQAGPPAPTQSGWFPLDRHRRSVSTSLSNSCSPAVFSDAPSGFHRGPCLKPLAPR